MFCQGTGIVPLLPMLQDLLEKETDTMVSFIYPSCSYLEGHHSLQQHHLLSISSYVLSRRSSWSTAAQVVQSCCFCKIWMNFVASGISSSEFSSLLAKLWLEGAPLFVSFFNKNLFNRVPQREVLGRRLERYDVVEEAEKGGRFPEILHHLLTAVRLHVFQGLVISI